MVSTLDLKLRRDLVASGRLLIAIVSMIVVGVVCYVTLRSAHANLSDAQSRFYRETRMADFWVDVKKAPVTDMEAIALLPGVRDVQTRIQFSATVDIEGAIEPINGNIVSLPDSRERIINDIMLRQGDYFSPTRSNEVIIDEKFARHHRIYPGDKVHVLLNNRRQELIVVGTALSSEFIYLLGPGAILPDPEHFGVFYIKRSFAEDVLDFGGAANQLVGLLGPNEKRQPDALMDVIEKQLDPHGVFSVTPRKQQASHQFLNSELEQLGSFGAFLPAVFLSVAALVLNVLLTRLVRQQRVTIGTLKAIGYSNSQVLIHFLKFGLAVGIVGGMVGTVLGYFASGGMTILYGQYYTLPDLHNELRPSLYISSMFVAIAVAVAGSGYGAWQVLGLKPAEAMRPEPPASGGKTWAERLTLLWRLLSPSWRLAIRSVLRHRVRSLVSVFSAAMGVALLVSGFMMREAGEFLLQFQFHDVNRADVEVAFDEEQGRSSIEDLKRLPGVQDVEPIFNLACTFRHGAYQRKGAISGLLPDSQLTIPKTADLHRIELPPTGIVMSRYLADLLHLQPADTVVVTPIKGHRQPLEMTVTAVADGYFGLSAYGDVAYLSKEMEESFVMTGAQIKLNNPDRPPLGLYQQLKDLPAVESVTLQRDMAERLTKMVNESQNVFVGVLVFFSGIIVLGSILNAALINLSERQREVATLRALGYTPAEVAGMFFRENILTTAAGTLLGLPMGYLLIALLVETFGNELIRLPLVTAPWIWFVAMGIAAGFAILAQWVVFRTIRALDVIEGLKVKE